jgi:MFS family permease
MTTPAQAGDRGNAVGIRAAFADSQFPVKVVLVGVLISRLSGFLNLFIVLYLTSKGYSTEQAAFALSAYGVGAVAGVLVGGTLANRLGPRNATVLSMSPAVILGGTLVWSLGEIIGGTLVWSLGEIIGGPATFAYPAIAAPARLKGHYIGSFQFMFGLGTAVGPAIGGFLFIRLGHGVWPVLALGSVLATALVLISVRQPPTAGLPKHPVQPEAAELPGIPGMPGVPDAAESPGLPLLPGGPDLPGPESPAGRGTPAAAAESPGLP